MSVKTVIFFLLGFIAVAAGAVAQPYPSQGGRFEVDQVEGCAPFTMNITVRAPSVCNGSNSCDMDFEGNNQYQNLALTHTYTQPGTYTLTIIFQASGTDQITITVKPNIEPAFDIYSCGNQEAQIKITDTNYDSYRIDYNDGSSEVPVPSGSLARDNHTFPANGLYTIGVRGINNDAADNCATKTDTLNVRPLTATRFQQLEAVDASHIKLDFAPNYHVQQRLFIAINNEGPFTQLQNEYNVATETLAGVTPDNNYYCFRLDAYDPCHNISLPSQIICSANFDITPQNNVNKLFWATGSTGVTDFAISRTPGPSLTAAVAARTLDDTDVQCGTNYTYQLTTSYAYGAKSLSLPKTVTAISTNIPAVIDNISAITGQNSVVLEWLQDPAYTAKEYTIRKSTDNGPFTTAGTSATPSYTDTPYAPQPPSCYTVGYVDACQNNSPVSGVVCPVVLTASLQQDNTINLTWSVFNGWKNGVQGYTLEKYNDQGELLSSVDIGSGITYSEPNQDFANQVAVYRIVAQPNDAGITTSVSNTVEVIKEPNLYYPSAFTPNTDGLNDIFKVFSQYTAVFEFRIFNRWGEMLFNSTDMNDGWDGTYKGNLMPEGTYTFRAKITDLSGRKFERSGTVVLLKK